MHLTLSDAQERIAKEQETLDKESEQLHEKMEAGDKEMKELKVQLYGKFGKAINLD